MSTRVTAHSDDSQKHYTHWWNIYMRVTLNGNIFEVKWARTWRNAVPAQDKGGIQTALIVQCSAFHLLGAVRARSTPYSDKPTINRSNSNAFDKTALGCCLWVYVFSSYFAVGVNYKSLIKPHNKHCLVGRLSKAGSAVIFCQHQSVASACVDVDKNTLLFFWHDAAA